MKNLHDLRNRKIFLESKIKLCEEHRLRIRRGLHALHIQHNKGLIENEKLHLELNKLHNGRTLQQWIGYYDDYVLECKKEIKEIDRKLSKDNVFSGVKNKAAIALLIFTFIMVGMFMIKPFFTGHATYIVNNQSSFNEGIYNYTFFNTTGLTFVQLNASNLTGNYTSKIYDAGSSVRWGNISWIEGIPYGEGLPNGTYDEKKNNVLGGANMTGNVLLLHLNDNSSSTAKEESGFANTGYIWNMNSTGNSTSGPTGDCKLGSCFLFDGTDDYINVSDNNLLNFDTSIDFSVGVWFKTNSVGQWIIAKSRTGGSGDAGGWVIKTNGPNISASLAANSGFGGGQITGPAVNDSNWHHVILAMNRNGGTSLDYALYTDGNSVTTSGASLNITVPVNLTIGMQMNFGQAPGFLNGTIDEVAIYNRTLSAAEVMEHYKRGALRLNVTVRSCDDSACSGENFNSTRFENSTFSSLNNIVTNNRYFQYQTFFFTDSTSYTPELYNVTVNYTVISNIAPNAPVLNAPLNNTNISSTSVLLNTTVSDNDGDTLTVWFYGNESIINTTTGVANGSLVTYNWTGLSDRNYNWSVIVGDGTANTSSGTYYFTIDITKPTIDFVSPTDNTNINVSRNWIYANVSTSDTNWHTAFTDFNKSLVGWWRFNNESGENSTFFRDYSSYANNGTCSGTGCPAYNQSGKFGSAYTFDGSDDFVNSSNSVILDTLKDITVETWIKIENTDAQLPVVAKWDVGEYSYLMDIYNKGPRFIVRNSSASQAISSGNALTPGLWYHVVGEYNTTSVLLYVNGISVGSLSGTIPSSLTLSTEPVYIGKKGDSSGEWFNGTIDEVKIWNRTLSAVEINSSYNAGLNKLFRNFTNLADGIYTFTSYAQDSAGNVNNTETRTVTVDTTKPTIDFVSPTDSTSTNVSRNWIYANVSITESNWHTAFTDFNKSLVGWWRFNNESGENSTFFRDWSSYGNNATCSGVNCSTYNQSGKFGSAYTFDGYDDFINITTPNSIDFSSSVKNFTILAWVYPFSTVNRNVIFASMVTPDSISSWQVYLYFQNGAFIAQQTNGTSPQISLEGNTGKVANKWYMVAWTYNLTNLSLYVDGVLERTSAAKSPAPSPANREVYIGNFKAWPGSTFNGTIDEVQIWNRTLSAEEINSSYNAGLNKLSQNYTGLNDGVYTFTSYAQDSAGNVNNTETRTVTVDTNAPTIPQIQTINSQSPTEASTTKITFETNISDISGTGAINSVRASFTKSGETTRSNNTCISVANVNSTLARYQCSVDMYWFDTAGIWNINVTAYDGAVNSGTNTSTTFTYNSLKAFTVGPSSGISTGLIWPLISLRDTNIVSNNDPLLLNNTGNTEITSGGINVTGYNLIGETINTQYLSVANMSVHFTTGSSVECTGGIALTNNTATIVTGANITKGNYTVNDGTTGQEQLYFCLRNVLSSTSTAQQSYSTSGGSAWIIGI